MQHYMVGISKKQVSRLRQRAAAETLYAGQLGPFLAHQPQAQSVIATSAEGLVQSTHTLSRYGSLASVWAILHGNREVATQTVTGDGSTCHG